MNYKKTESLQEDLFGKLSKMRAYVRESLWELGYSRDQHIYELKDDIYFEHRAKKNHPYLFRIIDLFYSLTKWEKQYFVYEILEKGRHYMFWHSDMTSRVYASYEKEALMKIQEGLFDGCETPF